MWLPLAQLTASLCQPLLRGSSPVWLPDRNPQRTTGAGSAHRTICLEKHVRMGRVPRKTRKPRHASTWVRVHPLRRAEDWAALIDGESIKSRADLARHLKVSRARVTQVLAVLSVRSDVRQHLLSVEERGRSIPDRIWRRMAKVDLESCQALLGEGGFAPMECEQCEQGGSTS